MEKLNNEQIKTFSAFDVSDIETDVSDRNMKFIILPNGMLYRLNDRLNFCINTKR